MIDPHASGSYAAIMLAAIGLGFFLSREPQKRLQLGARQRWGIAFGAFCGAMIASKLPFVLTHPRGPLFLGAWLDNGKTILGGLVGSYLGVEAAKWLLGVKVKTGDSFAVPVAVAVGVGRLSCFVAGCCYGTVTSLPWGVDFGDGIPRHPTQIYEIIFCLTAFAVIQRRLPTARPGSLMSGFLTAYFVFRFLEEFLRAGELRFGLTPFQWICLAGLTLIGIRAILYSRVAATKGTEP